MGLCYTYPYLNCTLLFRKIFLAKEEIASEGDNNTAEVRSPAEQQKSVDSGAKRLHEALALPTAGPCGHGHFKDIS